jgi:transketolase N-terminal domain/subunit
VDKGIHIGGAFSAVVPLVALYYSGVIRIDVENPTRVGQDLFVLSKGHAVAPMASIYTDLGYFDRIRRVLPDRRWGAASGADLGSGDLFRIQAPR